SRGRDGTELDPGIEKAEGKEHQLHRQFQSVFDGVEQICAVALLLGEDAEIAVGMRDRWYDGQKAKRRMQSGPRECVPAQAARQNIWPRRQGAARPSRNRPLLMVSVKITRQAIGQE